MTATTGAGGLDLPRNARALLEAVLAISSDLDLHSVLDRIVVAACEITGARYGALGVLGDAGGLSRLRDHRAGRGGAPRDRRPARGATASSAC